MATYYHTQESGGDRCADSRDLYIMLYPNTSTEKPYSKSGSIITNALDDMAQQLLNANAISYYDIQRFHVEDYKYPNLSDTELDNQSCWFLDYLKGPKDSSCSGKTNGTGDDLSGVIGCHVLLHSQTCDTSTVTAGAWSEDCTDGSAFVTGRMAFTSVSCSSDSLTKSSVIQEPLHQFTRAGDSDVKALFGDCDDDGDLDYYDEHSLGKIYGNNDASPLLTYHESECDNTGDCKTTYSHSGWDQNLTSCTKKAVERTSDNLCESVPEC